MNDISDTEKAGGIKVILLQGILITFEAVHCYLKVDLD